MDCDNGGILYTLIYFQSYQENCKQAEKMFIQIKNIL